MSARDPHRALIAALEDRLGPLNGLISHARPWASVTFTGMRHELSFRTDASLEGLGEAELAMGGHFVADISAERGPDGLIRLEALSLEVA